MPETPAVVRHRARDFLPYRGTIPKTPLPRLQDDSLSNGCERLIWHEYMEARANNGTSATMQRRGLKALTIEHTLAEDRA